MRCVVLLASVTAIWGALASPVQAQAKETDKRDKEVAEAFEKFAKAFNSTDAKALASFWSEKGEYISDDTGTRLNGRKEIEADYANRLKTKGPGRLEIDIDHIRYISADVASVDGSAKVYRPKEAVMGMKFFAIMTKENGAWLLDSVHETESGQIDNTPAALAELNWIDGVWSHKDGDVVVTLSCEEVANGNFRAHRFHVTDGAEIIHEGVQIIGWDPEKRQLRSWVFSSDGSFGEGTWEKQGNRWLIKASGILPDGEHSMSTQIIERKGDNQFIWQVVDRHVGAQALPNSEPITLTKAAPATTKKGE